jgi:hypothetical protein
MADQVEKALEAGPSEGGLAAAAEHKVGAFVVVDRHVAPHLPTPPSAALR